MQDRQTPTYERFKAFTLERLSKDQIQYGEDAFIAFIESLKLNSQQEFMSGNSELALYYLKLIIEVCTEKQNHPSKHVSTLVQALKNSLVIIRKQSAVSYHDAMVLFQNYEVLFKETFQEKNNQPLLYAYYGLIQFALAEQKYPQAQFYCEELLRIQDAYPDIALQGEDLADVFGDYALLLFRKKEYKDSQVYLQKALLILRKFHSEDNPKIAQLKLELSKALSRHIEKQKAPQLPPVLSNVRLLNGDHPTDLNTYISLSSCHIRMGKRNNQIAFKISGDGQNLAKLKASLQGTHGLLNLMNQSSQSGIWSLRDMLPEHDAKEPCEGEITLYYCDKRLHSLFTHLFDEELYLRSREISKYFATQGADIWYHALTELSGYFHLTLLSNLKNILHDKIFPVKFPESESIYTNLGDLEYILNPDIDQLDLADRLSVLSTFTKDFKVDPILTAMFRQLGEEIQARHEPQNLILLMDQYLDKLKEILLKAYSGDEKKSDLKLQEWLKLVSCLQLLNIFKARFVRQQLLLENRKNAALEKREEKERHQDYEYLQTSKALLLASSNQEGTYVVADPGYPETQSKGWPFKRRLKDIECLHGVWNTRRTVHDAMMIAPKENRFHFADIVEDEDIVVDFGAGNGNFLRDLAILFEKLGIKGYFVGIGIDKFDDANLPYINEAWYMPLPLAENIQAFVERFKGKVKLGTCTFGAFTYAKEPHKVAILAAYLLRRGGHFTAIVSSQPGHYDGTPIGYIEDRKKLAAFLQKHTGVEMTGHPTAIKSAVVEGSIFTDFKLDLTRPLDAPDITLSLDELFQLADVEIGIAKKIEPNPDHPYKFNSQSIIMKEFGNQKTEILEMKYIEDTKLEILPIEDVGIAFQIELKIKPEGLEILYQKVSERLGELSKTHTTPDWDIAKNTATHTLTITYFEPVHRHFSMLGQYHSFLSFLISDTRAGRDLWIRMIDTLMFNGILVPGVSEKIDSFEFPLLEAPSQSLSLPRHGDSYVFSFHGPDQSFRHQAFISHEPYPHPETGEPVFKFTWVAQNEGEPRVTLGSFSLYGQPDFCRTPEGGHNVIFPEGIFVGKEVNTDNISAICTTLPTTVAEQCVGAAVRGGLHGFIAGGANVCGRFAKNTSYLSRAMLTEGVYCVAYFGYRLFELNESAADETDTYDIASQALTETATTAIVRNTQKIVHTLSGYANNNGWHKSGSALNLLGNALGLTLFGFNVRRNGVMPTLASVASGATAQVVVENGADQLASLFKAKRN